MDHLVDDLQEEINCLDETDGFQPDDMAVFAELRNCCALKALLISTFFFLSFFKYRSHLW